MNADDESRLVVEKAFQGIHYTVVLVSVPAYFRYSSIGIGSIGNILVLAEH